MADNVYLELIGQTQGAIHGESATTSLGRADKIECVAYDNAATAALTGAGAGMATGRHSFGPFIIRKRIDKSSPLLLRALTTNEDLHGTFRFYRPSPSGDGTTQQFYTVEFSNARLSAVRQYVPDTLLPETSNLPPLEEVSIIASRVTWTYVEGNIAHTTDVRVDL
jgi:type VI secretion system secreted protein Hcp